MLRRVHPILNACRRHGDSSFACRGSPLASPRRHVTATARSVAVTCIDSRGAVTSQELSVTGLRDATSLSWRELTIVETHAPLVSPRVLPRTRAILVVVGAVRAIVMADRCLLFSVDALPGARAFASSLGTQLRVAAAGPVWAEPTPFEHTVLERALLGQAQRHARRIAYAGALLDALLARVSAEGNGGGSGGDAHLGLFPLASSIAHYELSARGLVACIRALLDDPAAMREACLSDKASARGAAAATPAPAAPAPERLGRTRHAATQAQRGRHAVRDLEVPDGGSLGAVVSAALLNDDADDLGNAGGAGSSSGGGSGGVLAAVLSSGPARHSAASNVRGRASAATHSPSDALVALELMLESCHQVALEAMIAAAELQRTIKLRQELLLLLQARDRNALLTRTLRVSVVATSLSGATLVVSVFGANLLSGFEGVPLALWPVAAASLVVGSSTFLTLARDPPNAAQLPAAGAATLAELSELLHSLDDTMSAARNALVLARRLEGAQERAAPLTDPFEPDDEPAQLPAVDAHAALLERFRACLVADRGKPVSQGAAELMLSLLLAPQQISDDTAQRKRDSR